MVWYRAQMGKERSNRQVPGHTGSRQSGEDDCCDIQGLISSVHQLTLLWIMRPSLNKNGLPMRYLCRSLSVRDPYVMQRSHCYPLQMGLEAVRAFRGSRSPHLERDRTLLQKPLYASPVVTAWFYWLMGAFNGSGSGWHADRLRSDRVGLGKVQPGSASVEEEELSIKSKIFGRLLFRYANPSALDSNRASAKKGEMKEDVLATKNS